MPAAEDLAKTESAATLARRIRRKEVSPVEVVDAAIARIEEHNPKINALIIFGYDDARKAAKAAEAAIMRGDEVGPLHGVPIAMKDCFDFKPGWVTTFGGIRALENYVVDIYCMFVERMEKAGAIFVGKTNSPVFGFRGTCDNYLYGPSKNPFDLTKNTGGSSGGSAGAVAAGLLPLCEGTDGGGSIRIPSSWCGVYGYKPAFGRVPLVTRPEAFGGNDPLHLRGPDHPHRRGRRVGDDACSPATIRAIPMRSKARWISWPRCAARSPARRSPIRATTASSRSIRASSPWSTRRSRPSRRRARMSRRWRSASAARSGSSRDVWCRFIAPKQVAALEGFKREGIDLVRDHHDDFPPEFWHWDEIGRRMTVTDFIADQAMRTEVFDALRTRARPLRLPRLADARLPRRRQRERTATPSGRRRSTANRSTA